MVDTSTDLERFDGSDGSKCLNRRVFKGEFRHGKPVTGVLRENSDLMLVGDFFTAADPEKTGRETLTVDDLLINFDNSSVKTPESPPLQLKHGLEDL